MIGYLTLAVSLTLEMFGATMLKLSKGFTKWLPAVLVVFGYGSAFYFFSKSLTYLPLNLAYATWAGLGTSLTKRSLLGLVLIVCGVFILNLSGVASHG